MSKEYTYSMPQQFMDDQNVALKWKLYGYLNGFWIAGKPVYARNDTIAKNFNKSDRAVQAALEELERMGLITRDIKGLSRYILPGGLKVEGRSPASPIHEAQLHPRDEAQLHHISDNTISDNKPSELASEIRVVEVFSSEETGGRPAGRLSKTEKEKLLPLIGWAERERGFNFLSTEKGKQLKALSLAKENGLKAAQLKERWEEMSIDKFWAKAGFDWYNVVQSFNKKGA